MVGARGVFSSLVAPALVLDRRGLPWVAATTGTGRVLAGTLRGTRIALRDVGVSAPTASPALAVSRTRRPVLAATSPTGTPGGGSATGGTGGTGGAGGTTDDDGPGLAYTGATVWPALAVAVLLMLLGTGFVLVSRRRRGLHA